MPAPPALAESRAPPAAPPARSAPPSFPASVPPLTAFRRSHPGGRHGGLSSSWKAAERHPRTSLARSSAGKAAKVAGGWKDQPQEPGQAKHRLPLPAGAHQSEPSSYVISPRRQRERRAEAAPRADPEGVGSTGGSNQPGASWRPR